MKNAKVSRIQRFSVGDGPGIRTTVFFQGCNLRCPWCHNPETISSVPEFLYYERLCVLCKRCASVCGLHSFSGGKHIFDRKNCISCGKCAEVCPAHALELSGKEYTVSELSEKIFEDMDFYRESGGGVTFSGGEPLLQADFCAVLAEKCKENGIPVLLDTAGSVPYSSFEKIIPYIDICYFDIKSGREEKYNEIGGKLLLILENLKKLCESEVETVVRIPVIPAFNNSIEEMSRIAERLENISVSRVDLLPFHRLGSGKYDALGIKYLYSDVESVKKTDIERLFEPFKKLGIKTAFGG